MSKSQFLKKLENLENWQKERALKLVDDTLERFNAIYKALYNWQTEFIEATKFYSQCCLIAANRIGKTYLGTFIDAVHLTGIYPDAWHGYRFDHAPLIWCLGYSGEKTRDLLQDVIIGRLRKKQFINGLISHNKISELESMQGTARAYRTVLIEHQNALLSKLQFWSYTQGQEALMGDSISWYHIDEEPKDQNIFPQVLTRTATGGNMVDETKNIRAGGRGILTFTPEHGRTDTVINFMDNPSPDQFCMQKGWDDAPHLSDSVKESLISSYPAHQRDMRTKGTPMLGHGRIYELSDDSITIDPIPIPDHWLIIGGMDFGYDHPQAHVQLAINPDTQAIYLTHSFKVRQQSAVHAWIAVKSWQKDIPVAWPQDGLMHEKGREDVKQQKDHYIEAGFKLLGSHATFDGKSNSVEQGIYELRELMTVGKFSVFKGQADFLDEFSQYHRDDRGRIVKTRDDLLDAVRYAYMMRRFAKAKGTIGKKAKTARVPPRKSYF